MFALVSLILFMKKIQMMKRFWKCLVWLIAFGLSIISFWYCTDDVATLLNTYTIENITIPQQWWGTLINLQSLGLQYKTLCIKFIQSNLMTTDWGPTRNYQGQPWTVYRTWWNWIGDWKYTCTYVSSDPYLNWNSPDWINTFDIEYFILEDLMATPLPLMSSLQCQSEYSLIPLSSVDSNYCSSNWLCPSYYVNLSYTNSNNSSSALISDDIDLIVWTWITVDETESPSVFRFDWDFWLWGWSALYINDIQHVGAPIINITIPEEFNRDYTWTDDQFDLDVKWYNVDTDYIDWIITKQTTLPNNTDFSNIISWLIPLFIPWLVIIACLYFIFRFIKKVF